MRLTQSRRQFVASSLAGCFGLITSRPVWAEPLPETSTVRLPKFFPAGCEIPQCIATELLRAEGITDVRYLVSEGGVDTSVSIAGGELDFDWNYALMHIVSIDAGVPITVLTGLHSGCLELIANDAVSSIRDLKGKKVGVYALSSSPHILVSNFAADYEFALQTLTDVRNDRWREFDPEDTMRFYSLRLQEVGLIRANPHEIIANGTNWAFLNELKRELKT